MARYWKKVYQKGWYLVNKNGHHIKGYGPYTSVITAENALTWNHLEGKYFLKYEEGVEKDYV